MQVHGSTSRIKAWGNVRAVYVESWSLYPSNRGRSTKGAKEVLRTQAAFIEGVRNAAIDNAGRRLYYKHGCCCFLEQFLEQIVTCDRKRLAKTLCQRKCNSGRERERVGRKDQILFSFFLFFCFVYAFLREERIRYFCDISFFFSLFFFYSIEKKTKKKNLVCELSKQNKSQQKAIEIHSSSSVRIVSGRFVYNVVLTTIN